MPRVTCVGLLPKASELKGWEEVKDSFVRAKGQELTKLYDGGYNLYLEHGVVEAAQKLYRKDKLYLTVTAHTMKDAKTAVAFVTYWNQIHKGEQPVKTRPPGTGFTLIANGATTIYWANDRFFVTIMIPSAGKEAQKEALAALQVTAKKTVKKPGK
jgi:hypothetical protein